MTEANLITDITQGIATITLNRPDALNALGRGVILQLRSELASLAERSDVGAIVLTGSGRAFCAGADLKDPMMGQDLPRAERARNCREVLDNVVHALIRDLAALPQPTVAAVNGIAAGGGVGLALAADIVIAARSASFLFPFVPKLAMVPDLGATWQLARRVGRARALGIALLGEPLPAATAAEWGLIWRCVEDADLRTEAQTVAARLAAGPHRAQRETVQLIDQAYRHDLPAQLDAEAEVQSRMSISRDAEEAIAAFVAKRPPRFTGE
ncbi:MAG: enoyl-CoA hydratase/isomerase family protein [Gammaproteobacteria bacterium]|nr:enoyl-CoA hydratase/isomerase family protein [Gammaproteobacteria bacterium]